MLPLFKVFMSDEAIQSASDVLSSGYIGQGPKVESFEKSIREYLGVLNAQTTNSATSAEHLLYHALKAPAFFEITEHNLSRRCIEWHGLDETSEVLATPLTCTATNWPILANGLKLKWVDIDPTTLSLDLTDLRRKLSPTTKAISVVHWGGYPADLDSLYQIQEECYSIYGFMPIIIEDCAHALGSKFNEIPIGAHGNFCTFSFQAIKQCTSVDGGALISPDSAFARRIKLLRWYGIDREENRNDFRCEANIPEWGFKFHMNDVSAAIGEANLKYSNDLKQKNQRIRNIYNQALSDIAGVQLVQQDPEGKRDINPWLYSMLVRNKSQFMNAMRSRGIAVSQVHERNDKHSCVSEYKSHLPSLDKICSDLVCIPCGWWLTDENATYIADCIKEGW